MAPLPSDHPEELLAESAWLLNLTRRLLQDAGQAEDLAQDTMVAALSQPTWGAGSPRPWLAGIARNLARRHLRSQRRRLEREAQAARCEHDASTAEVLMEAAAHRSVVNAVMDLAEPYRSTLLLRYWEGLPPREIARRTQTSVQTIQTRLKRARALLRERLDESHGSRALWVTHLSAWVGRFEVTPEVTTLPGLLAQTTLLLMKAHPFVFSAALVLGLVLLSTPLWPGGEPLSEGQTPEPSSQPGLAESPLPKLPAATSTVGARRVPAHDDEVEAAAPPATGASLLVRVLHSDGTPAGPGIPIQIRSNPPQDSQRTQSTTSNGSAIFDRIDAGLYELSLDRRAHMTIELEAKDQQQALLRMSPGVLVTGIVRDGQGSPIPGASIHLIDRHHQAGRHWLARSDARGEFELRDVPERSELWVDAPGFLPTSPRGEDVRGVAGESTRMEFVLEAKAKRLRGRISNAAGEPMADLPLVVGLPENPSRPELPPTSKAIEREFTLAQSDGDGRFEIDAAPTGSTLLLARAPAPRDDQIAVSLIPADQDPATELAIEMRAGAELTGVVRDEAGVPVPEILVSALWMGSKLHGEPGKLGAPWLLERRGQSDAKGHFRLNGLLPGEHQLWVKRKNGQAHASSKVTLLAEQARSRDLQIPSPPDHRLRIVVVDQDGQPQAGLNVCAWIGDGVLRRTAELTASKTTSNGSCLIEAQANAAHVAAVFLPGPEAAHALPLATVTEVWPGRETRITVPNSKSMLASLRGRILRWDGKPLGRGEVEILPVDFPMTAMRSVGQDGRFEVGQLPEGSYELFYWGDSVPAPSLGRVTLGAGELRDLGDWYAPRPGSLSVRLRLPTDEVVRSPRVRLRALRSQEVDRQLPWLILQAETQGIGLAAIMGNHPEPNDDGSARYSYSPLAPGDYELAVWSTNHLPHRQRLTIEAGRGYEIPVELKRGLPVTITVDVSAIERKKRLGVSIAVFDQAGACVIASSALQERLDVSERSKPFHIELAPGQYRVLAKCESAEISARSTETQLHLEPSVSPGASVRLEF